MLSVVCSAGSRPPALGVPTAVDTGVMVVPVVVAAPAPRGLGCKCEWPFSGGVCCCRESKGLVVESTL